MKRCQGGGKIKILQAASESLAEVSPLTLALVGLGAIIALPALRKGVNSAADAAARGFRDTSEAVGNLAGNVKSGWGSMVQDVRTSCANAPAGRVGAMTGAAIGGVVGASAGGPLGAGLGAVVGGGLGGTVGCHRTAAEAAPADTGDGDVS